MSKSLKLTVFLISRDVQLLRQALDPDGEFSGHALEQVEASEQGTRMLVNEGEFFLGSQRHGSPEWLEAINTMLQEPVRAVTAGVSAVLLLRVSGRVMAITFGRGRAMLNPVNVVRGFGLRVALNRVDPDKLRTVDSRTYDQLVISGRKQTSRSTGIGAFGVDVARDLVRGVAGETKDDSHFRHVAGADSVTITTDLPFDRIWDICEDLLAASEEQAYLTSFAWVDHVQLEKNITRVRQLNELLIQAVNNGESDQVYLAFPDLLDWDTGLKFKYTRSREEFNLELSLTEYLRRQGGQVGSIDELKRHVVRVYRQADAHQIATWSVFQCLVCEIEFEGNLYALFDGDWFRIKREFADEVHADILNIPMGTAPLPDSRQGLAEGDYNRETVQGNPARFALFDQVPLRVSGSTSNIELCDLLTSTGEFVHVKKRDGSSVLSHLFAQGSVSAEAFYRDSVFREQIISHLNSSGASSYAALIPHGVPRPSDFCIVYALIAKDSPMWPPRLPFFSAVNLRHHARRLQGLGFRVAVQYIKIR